MISKNLSQQINSSSLGLNEAFKKIQDCLLNIHPSKIQWEIIFQDLKSLIFGLFGDTKPLFKIHFFETTVEQLLNNFFPNQSMIQKINTQLWLGSCYESLQAWDKALAAYHRVIRLCNTGQFISQKTKAWRWISYIQMVNKRWQKALSSLQKSMELYRIDNNLQGQASVYNCLGILYFELGELRKSSNYWQKALELTEILQDDKLRGAFCNNLGILANAQGQWEKALIYYLESATQFEKLGNQKALAEIYHNIGMTYAEAVKLSDALCYYEKSSFLAGKIGDIHLSAIINLNRSKLHTSLSDYDLAEALCRRAFKMFSDVKDYVGKAEVYKCLGIIYTKQKQWLLAESYFQKSLWLIEKYHFSSHREETYLQYTCMLKKGYNE